MTEDDREAKYSGFSTRDQETKYNLTLFDLVMTLSARVTASLKLRTYLFLLFTWLCSESVVVQAKLHGGQSGRAHWQTVVTISLHGEP
jgi:hypothetical protein